MAALKNVTISNGSVTYVAAVPPRPTTEETHDNVTTVNHATPGKAAFFRVGFAIDATFADDEAESQTFFHLELTVAEPDQRAPYRAVEDRAARQIPLMFRQMADRIEADNAAFASRNPQT